MYEDNVLLKLRRDYSKDEVVMYALNKIHELQKELKVERDRNQKLSEEVNKVRVDLKCRDSLRQNNSQDHIIRHLRETNVSLNKSNKALKHKNIDLNDKLNILLTNPEHFTKKTLDEKVEFLKNMEVL